MAKSIGEARRQAEFCTAFSTAYPELYAEGMLFEVNNNVEGKGAQVVKKLAFRRAIGMQPGASDLSLISHKTGIEIKHENSKYSKASVARQQQWGKCLANRGGNYIMSHNIAELMEFADKVIKGATGLFQINDKWKLNTKK